MARVLVTGAGGFIGRALCPALAARGHRVIAGFRRTAAAAPVTGVEPLIIGEIAPGRDWSGALAGVDVVVHLAQRAHRRADDRDLADEPAAAADLARAARDASVRLLYVSSIKAMGEATAPGRPFRADDPPRPQDAYGRAKLATEMALARVAEEHGIELIVLRPPLIYGPGVGGNFRALMRLAGSGLPLPFAAVDNRRSLICIDNFVDLVATSIDHPAAGGVFLASDGVDLSTPALIRVLARAQQRQARLFALPAPVFAPARALPGIGPALARLTLSLQVDDSSTCAALCWSPPIAAEDALIRTARAFATQR